MLATLALLFTAVQIGVASRAAGQASQVRCFENRPDLLAPSSIANCQIWFSQRIRLCSGNGNSQQILSQYEIMLQSFEYDIGNFFNIISY